MFKAIMKISPLSSTKCFLHLAFIFVALICLAETARAQAIVGTVKTVAGVPIDGVLVRGVRTIPSLQVVTTTTDVSGGYVLGAGLSGTYTVQAIETGYTFTPATTNVTVSGSSVFGVNFTSPSTVPAATTSSATNVTATGATLLGSVNPNGGTTTAYFEYGLTASYGSVSGSVNLGNGTNSVPVSISVSNLLNGTNYHFRMVANNSHGTRTGTDTNFTTLSGIPSVTTLDPTDPGATRMRLNGSVIPDGANTSGWFEWGATTNYGNVTAMQALDSGTTATNFSEVLTGLVTEATYHYHAVSATSFATNYGADVLFTPLFSDIGAGLPGVYFGGAAWGDYDNDGRLDIFIAGIALSLSGQSIAQVWRNTGSGFTNINAGLPGIHEGSIGWGDFDNDGDLDILLTGYADSGLTAQLRRNTGSGFSLFQTLTPVGGSSSAFGDFDLDGRLDFVIAGKVGVASQIAKVWHNQGISGFYVYDVGPVSYGSSVWGDYDNDGNLEVLLTGGGSFVYQYRGGGFTNIQAGLPGVAYSSSAWGDYDNDGRLDIVLVGTTNGGSSGVIAQVWRNTGSGFTNIQAGLPGVHFGSVAWGDYDNDGRLDILLTGRGANNIPIAQIWRNTVSGFVNIHAALPAVELSAAAWGDYDNDGRLDILLTGISGGTDFAVVLRNNTARTNSPPSAPSGLAVSASNTVVTLSWNASTDQETPAAVLTYNVRVGTTPGGNEIFTAMADANGFRRVPQPGNVSKRLFVTFNSTVSTPYYCSVQAVDNAFAGSPFAPEISFKFLPVMVAATATNLVLGDANGDGIVSGPELAAVLQNLNGNGVVTESDLNLVLSNYWPYSPWLYMTNVAGLGGTNVTFALSNSTAGAFGVEYTTNLVDWFFLGPATPRYDFTDTNAPAVPQRYYRLRWP